MGTERGNKVDDTVSTTEEKVSLSEEEENNEEEESFGFQKYIMVAPSVNMVVGIHKYTIMRKESPCGGICTMVPIPP
eukprot:scaffold7955_cov93-Cylindrotheca_fusiformis.AAC.6